MKSDLKSPTARRTNRIFVRVFFIFSGLLLALTLLYDVLIIPLQRDSLLKVMYSQASIVSRSIIQASTDAMLTDDFGFVVEHNLQVVSNNKSIRSVLIVPKRGSVMRITPQGWAMTEADASAHELALLQSEKYGVITEPDGGSAYRYAGPIQFSGVPWGAIQMDFNTAEFDANISQMYRQLSYISILAVLIILPIGYFFARWLTRPIAIISEAASRVATGDLSAQVQINRQDEIGQLSDSFNQMVQALRQSREHLRHYNEELELKVTERTHELDELNRTLDQRVQDEIAKRKRQEVLLIQQSRLAAMGEMIGSIAHQWRQPLNALGLVLQNMAMQYRMGQLTEESMARMQDKAERLMERMSSTIDEFRNFFKPAKHQERFNLLKAITSSSEIMEATFKHHNIELTIECDPTIDLFGIAGEISQVFLNLLSNAKDAILAHKQETSRIAVRALLAGDRVLISVADTGGGIPESILDKIFEPYFTTKEEGQGTGIGLYMSKMIVEGYWGGELSATNLADGACLTIDLPIKTS